MTAAHDLVLVGGGLQSCLVALAALHRAPDTRLVIIEQAAALGGNHHWSFHAGDLPAEADAWVGPLIEQRWPDYDVFFPTYQRTVDAPYATITSTGLDTVVRAMVARAPNAQLMLGRRVERIDADAVTLEDGERVTGATIVDARGPERTPKGASAYQKFVGLTLRVSGTVPTRPVVMDARVDQGRGLRFMYVLPFADRVLIEDTYYDTTPSLDHERLRANILAYAEAHGMHVDEVLDEEHGVLPLPLERGETPCFAQPLRAGYAGGWLQPTTGYSFPVAVRLAMALTRADARAAVTELARRHDDQASFLRRLNRWLFRGIAPEHRWRLFAKFYRLPEDLIARFYAMEMGALERWRIVAGAPPKGMRVRELVRAAADA